MYAIFFYFSEPSFTERISVEEDLMTQGDIPLKDLGTSINGSQQIEHDLNVHSHSAIHLDGQRWDIASQSSETETELSANPNSHLVTVQADIHSIQTLLESGNLAVGLAQSASRQRTQNDHTISSEDLEQMCTNPPDSSEQLSGQLSGQLVFPDSASHYHNSQIDQTASETSQSEHIPPAPTSVSNVSESSNQNMDISDNINLQSHSFSENFLSTDSESNGVYPEQESPDSNVTIVGVHQVGVQPVNMDNGHPLINEISDLTIYTINLENSHLHDERDRMQGTIKHEHVTHRIFL